MHRKQDSGPDPAGASTTSSCVVVVGGGPAGMSAALWLKHLRLRPLLVERAPRLGGLPARSRFPSPYLLGAVGETGPSLASRFEAHVAAEGIATALSTEVTSVRAAAGGLEVVLGGAGAGDASGGERGGGAREARLHASALVLCTGTRCNEAEDLANLPGFQDARQAGRLEAGLPPHPGRLGALAGRHLVVVGGGDNAYDLAVSAGAFAAHVHLVHRRASRAQAWVQAEARRLERARRLTLWPAHELADLRELATRGELVLRDRDGTLHRLRADHVFCQLGFRPNSERWVELLRPLGELLLTRDGYVSIDADGRTSLPRVYAAGDLANPGHPCVATAIAAGTVAARTLERDLRAAGELG